MLGAHPLCLPTQILTGMHGVLHGVRLQVEMILNLRKTNGKLPERKSRDEIEQWYVSSNRFKLFSSSSDIYKPPELIASILTRFNELATELWPEPEKPESHASEFGNWRDGMENVPGL